MPLRSSDERLTFWGTIALAVVVCLVLIPLASLFKEKIFSLLDVRKWSRVSWFVVNLSFLVILVAIRFGPSMKQRWLDS